MFSSLPIAAAAYGQWSIMMWAYTKLVRRHLSPPWEDEDDFLGEVRAQYRIENVSLFCAFAFVLPLARHCCCLWAMEVLALLLHCSLIHSPKPLFLFPGLGSIVPPPLLLSSISHSWKIKKHNNKESFPSISPGRTQSTRQYSTLKIALGGAGALPHCGGTHPPHVHLLHRSIPRRMASCTVPGPVQAGSGITA